jgi:hypothetical protein
MNSIKPSITANKKLKNQNTPAKRAGSRNRQPRIHRENLEETTDDPIQREQLT